MFIVSNMEVTDMTPGTMLSSTRETPVGTRRPGASPHSGQCFASTGISARQDEHIRVRVPALRRTFSSSAAAVSTLCFERSFSHCSFVDILREKA